MVEKSAAQATLKKYRDYVNPSLARLLRMMGANRLEWWARGSVIRDEEGERYIDCLGSYGVFNLGHVHPRVVAAVRRQLTKMPLASKVLLNKPLADLAEKLAHITPGDLKYTFVCNSGAEGIEAALKLARLATGRKKLVSCINAFHGKTLGALSVSGRAIYREPFEPLLPECWQVPFGDAAAMASAVDGETAAVVLEPIQGEGGVVIPPRGYLEQVRRICDEKGALLVLDEVQTGIGRTGKMFCCEHEKVTPDLLVLAKALGGGVMPIGAVVGTERVFKALFPNPLLHTTTFGGNPLACAAALATLEVVEEEGLAERAARLGADFLARLGRMQERFPDVIQEVRGMGLLIGLELTDEALGGVLMPAMLRQGVLVAYTLNNPKVVRFEPPLVIETKELDQVADALENALAEARAFLESEHDQTG